MTIFTVETDAAPGAGPYGQSVSALGTKQAVADLGNKAVVLNSPRDLRLVFVFKGNTYSVRGE